MLVAAQYGECAVFTELNNLYLSKNNKLYVSMFTGTLVSPEMVSIMTLILERERYEILQLPMWQQRWILSVLSIVAPKDTYRMDNFGLAIDNSLPVYDKNEVNQKKTRKNRNRNSKVLNSKEVIVNDGDDDDDDDGDDGKY